MHNILKVLKKQRIPIHRTDAPVRQAAHEGSEFTGVRCSNMKMACIFTVTI
jgi:hypothetical protein